MTPHEAEVLREQRLAEERVIAEVGHPLPYGVLRMEALRAVEACEFCGKTREQIAATAGLCWDYETPDGYPEPRDAHGPFVKLDPPAAPLEVPLGYDDESCGDLWDVEDD